ncbi:MAG: hypothetical protein WCA07_02680 [Gloeobacterales cyanobacterium]
MLIRFYFCRQQIAGQRGAFGACPYRESHDVVTLQGSLRRHDHFGFE